MWKGPRRPCAAGRSCYKMWAGLNGFDPRTDFVLGGVRIGMDCMNLVTVISRYTQVPVTLTVTTLAMTSLMAKNKNKKWNLQACSFKKTFCHYVGTVERSLLITFEGLTR